MGQSTKYENQLVWVLMIGVMIILFAMAAWLYNTNLVTFGLKRLNAAGCSGDESAIHPRNGSIFGKKCVKPLDNDPTKVHCPQTNMISDYTTSDGYTGTCFMGTARPTINF